MFLKKKKKEEKSRYEQLEKNKQIELLRYYEDVCITNIKTKFPDATAIEIIAALDIVKNNLLMDFYRNFMLDKML